LFDNIAPEERALVKFVIVFGERGFLHSDYIEKTVNLLETTFREYVDEGMLEVLISHLI
jgi:hypothetical protein